MSRLHYSGRTPDGLFVADEVDTSSDYVYRITEKTPFFIRLTKWWENEDETGGGIAFAGFADKDVYKVIWGKKISLTREQCEEEGDSFQTILHDTLLEFSKFVLDGSTLWEIYYTEGENKKYKKYITYAHDESDALKTLKQHYYRSDCDLQLISITHVLNDEQYVLHRGCIALLEN